MLMQNFGVTNKEYYGIMVSRVLSSSMISPGEGKRWNEFAEWHCVAWLAE